MSKFLLLPCLLMTQFLSAQNVGIGTTTPNARLHVVTSGSEVLRVEGTNPYISFFDGSTYRGYLWYPVNQLELGTSTSHPVVIRANYNNVAHFTPEGRVGINTATPAERLDVNGIVNLRGLKINGSAGSYGQVYTTGGPSIAPQWRNVAYSNSTRCAIDLSSTGVSGATNISSTIYNLTPADITVGSNSLTINKSGLYRFEGNYRGLLQGSGYSANPEGSFNLVFTGSTPFTYSIETFSPFRIRTIVNNNWLLSGHFSLDLHVTAPTTVQLSRSFLTSGGSTTHSEATGKLFVHLINE